MEEVIKMLPKYRIPIVTKRKKTGGKKRKTHEQYIEELKNKNPNVQVIGKYINAKTKITHYCLIHNIYWEASPSCILQGCGCKLCKKDKLSNSLTKTHKEYVEKLKDINPNIEVIDEYIDSNTKIKHHCLLHDVIWESKPSNTLQGKGCKECMKEKVANKNKKSHNNYVDELYFINPNIVVKEKYVNSYTAILHECVLHNITWMGIPASVLASLGCPQCIKEKLGHSLHKTHEEYLDELKIKNPNVIPLEKYINSKTPILHYHKNCGHKTKMQPSTVLEGKGCLLCKGIKISKGLSKTHEQFVQEMYAINENIEIQSEYINGNNKVQCKCKICENIWNARANHLLQGHGCPICSISIVADKLRKEKEVFIQELLIINPYIEVLGDYKTTNQKILCRCKNCSFEWNATPAKLLNKRGCPVCNESIGERTINIFLTINTIPYIKYHKYNDLIGVGNRLLSYDFYLPQYNLLIEFQGKQHEKPIEFFGGEEQFKIQQEHDRRKRNYAKEHNINLLEIWYYDIDNIETILTEYINNLKLESVTTTGVA